MILSVNCMYISLSRIDWKIRKMQTFYKKFILFYNKEVSGTCPVVFLQVNSFDKLNHLKIWDIKKIDR